MADYLSSLKLESAPSSLGLIKMQKSLIDAPTPDQQMGQFLSTQGSAINNGSTGGAIVGGILKGLGQAKMSKAEEEKAAKYAKLQDYIQQYQQQADLYAQHIEQQRTIALSQLEKEQKQAAMDTAVFSALQSGDPIAIKDVINGSDNFKKVLAMQMPDGATVTDYKIVDGNLVATGQDAQGNLVFGQPVALPALFSTDGANKWAEYQKTLLEQQKMQADINKTNAQTAQIGAESTNVGQVAQPSLTASTGDTAQPKPTPKLTEDQGKNVGFATRMRGAMDTLNGIESTKGYDPANLTETLLSSVPGGNFAVSDNYQKYQQAQQEFLAGILRGDTGAAITKEEFNMYGPMYFPQPGDGAQVRKQKAEARVRALAGTMARTGPGAAMVGGSADVSQTAPAAQAQTESTKTINGVTYIKQNGQWYQQ